MDKPPPPRISIHTCHLWMDTEVLPAAQAEGKDRPSPWYIGQVPPPVGNQLLELGQGLVDEGQVVPLDDQTGPLVQPGRCNITHLLHLRDGAGAVH